jgi:hypothetical protein
MPPHPSHAGPSVLSDAAFLNSSASLFRCSADAAHENKVDRPALFPPTFLYTQSWEDPEPDMKVGGFESEMERMRDLVF